MPRIPLMTGSWTAMSVQQISLFRERLRHTRVAGPGGDVDLGNSLREPVRYLKLSCYPGWVLVEADITLSPGETATINVVYGPGALWLVDGNATFIHSLNNGDFQPDGRSPALAPALAPLNETVTGPEYLRFFCGAVWGGEGPFTIVEDANHPCLAGADDDLTWVKDLKPLSMRRDEDDLVADAVVVYGDSAFQARFRIQKGQVIMEEDTPLGPLAQPPRRHWPPFRDLRAPISTMEEA